MADPNNPDGANYGDDQSRMTDPNDPFLSKDSGYKWNPDRGHWEISGNKGDMQMGAENMSREFGDTMRTGWNQWNGTGGKPGTREQIWNAINGGHNAQVTPINQQIGQTGPVQQSMGPDGAQNDQGRNAQMGLIQQLQDQAAGRGPSIAQMQLQKGTETNLANAMALGQSQRGAGAAGMLKGIQTQQAGISQGMANDSAMLRMQEQMQARNALGQNLGQMRGQDQGWAGMGLQNNQFNAGQYNTNMNSNADRGQSASEAQAKIDLELEKLRQQNAQNTSPIGMVGGLFKGIAMSDERLKEDIKPGDDALYAFLDGIDAHDYKYKSEKHGKGRRISPMAQELEKTPLGEEFVFETEDGKGVDYGKGLGTMLAAVAAMHKRVKKIEGK